jgi:hypothetical protein
MDDEAICKERIAKEKSAFAEKRQKNIMSFPRKRESYTNIFGYKLIAAFFGRKDVVLSFVLTSR